MGEESSRLRSLTVDVGETPHPHRAAETADNRNYSRIDRGPAGMAAVRRELCSQLGEIENGTDLAQQVILRDTLFEINR
jgi:hypothetical protein